MSWFSQQWDRLSRAWDDDSDHDQPITHLNIIWGRERLVVVPPFNRQAEPRNLPTLGDLRGHLSELTSIPRDEMKLVYHGLILKDDSLPLRTYNIRSDAKIMLVGTSGGAGVGDRPGDKVSRHAGESGPSRGAGGQGAGADGSAPRNPTKGELLAEERRRKEADRSEEGVTARIDEVVKHISTTLQPQLEAFEMRAGQGSKPEATGEQASTSTADVPSAPAEGNGAQTVAQPQQSLAHTQRLLNEMLSRSLLQLDAIPTVSENTRKHRKEAVKTTQSLIDRLDAAWEKVPIEEKRKG
ncbi:unnamed protein product [Parajaminaea phylloscopi]